MMTMTPYTPVLLLLLFAIIGVGVFAYRHRND